MTGVALFDAVTISGTRKTGDGYMVADAKVARTGVQEYLGIEVDRDGSLGLRDKQIVRVYRPEEEVFSEDAMRSYAYRPVTNDHPTEAVTAENWRRLSVGQTDGKVVRNGDWVQVPMVLMDAAMVAQVEGGKRQLSMGYRCTLDATPGTTPDGVQYDAVQRNLRMNHLAVVDAARAGPDARIGDAFKDAPRYSPGGMVGAVTNPAGDHMEDSRMTANTQKVVVDGISYEMSDQGAQLVARLNKQLSDAVEEDKKKEKELAKKDTELAAKDTRIAELEKSQITGDALDSAVAARAELIDRAKRIAPKIETKGLSDAGIKKAVVIAAVGDSMKDKSEAYIDARFDMLADEKKVTDMSQEQLRRSLADTVAIGDDAQTYSDAVSKANNSLNAHRTK